MMLKIREKLLGDIARLENDWCVPGAIPPLPQAIADLKLLLMAIPPTAAGPEVEADETTGFLTLRWLPPNHPFGFSFILRGDGHVLAVTTQFEPPQVTSKAFDLRSDHGSLERYLAGLIPVAQ